MQRAVAERPAASTGAGQQGVEAPVRLGAAGEGPLSLVLVGEIGGDPDEVGVATDPLGQLQTVVFAQRDHEQARPLGREALGRRFGDAGGPRDAADLAGQTSTALQVGHGSQACTAMSTNSFTDVE